MVVVGGDGFLGWEERRTSWVITKGNVREGRVQEVRLGGVWGCGEGSRDIWSTVLQYFSGGGCVKSLYGARCTARAVVGPFPLVPSPLVSPACGVQSFIDSIGF